LQRGLIREKERRCDSGCDQGEGDSSHKRAFVHLVIWSSGQWIDQLLDA
jgi:hypothetical protein